MTQPPKTNPAPSSAGADPEAPELDAEDRQAVREIILRRRAKFVAAALAAGVAAASGGCETAPQPCLGVTPFGFAGTANGGEAGVAGFAGQGGDAGAPQPCLSPPVGGDGGAGGDGNAGGDAGASGADDGTSGDGAGGAGSP